MSSPAAGGPSPRRDAKKLAAAKIKGQYLLAYNTLSAVLWAVILGRVLLVLPLAGFKGVYAVVGDFTKWTQTLALMEVLHSLTGLVRSPVFTTGTQVISRLNLVWPILWYCPNSMRDSPAYTSMVVAWSITEIVRYSYYVLNLSGEPPAALVWLRYNLFFILYPVGILSECWELYGSLDELKTRNELAWYVEQVVLYITYVPGAYILYTHMIRQRRKIMRGKEKMRSH